MEPSNFEMVREFHKAFDCPVAQAPRWPMRQRRQLRLALIDEELGELRAAIETLSMTGVMDALGDLLYVVYGTGHEFGIQLDVVFAEIHRSNMSKLGDDGKPVRREDGKILKGPNFTPPELGPLLEARNKPALRARVAALEAENARMRETLEAVCRNDKTPAYEYGEKNALGHPPRQPGQRWNTPAEMARAALNPKEPQ